MLALVTSVLASWWLEAALHRGEALLTESAPQSTHSTFSQLMPGRLVQRHRCVGDDRLRAARLPA